MYSTAHRTKRNLPNAEAATDRDTYKLWSLWQCERIPFIYLWLIARTLCKFRLHGVLNFWPPPENGTEHVQKISFWSAIHIFGLCQNSLLNSRNNSSFSQSFRQSSYCFRTKSRPSPDCPDICGGELELGWAYKGQQWSCGGMFLQPRSCCLRY